VAIFSADEAEAAAKELGGPLWVVKSQIHAGGRGKGTFIGAPKDAKGGVRLIEDGSDIETELYLSIIINRETSQVSFIASTEGGMDIEAVAHDTPEKVVNFDVDPATGFMPHHGRTLAKALGLSGDLAKQCRKLGKTLYDGFLAKDMSMLEINPLIVTEDGRLHCLDAKISFDGNALFRHPDIEELRDITEEDPKETEAKKYDLSYVALDGNIGCMVNGAGLAMSTMDIIKLYGAEPANFLDVGGGATKENIVAAFKRRCGCGQRSWP